MYGALYYGAKMADVLRAFSLHPATVGKTFYVTDEGRESTYAGTVIYLAAGQLYIYSPEGAMLNEVEIPERPTGLLFGGPGGRTLYILTRTSLYTLSGAAQ